LEIGTPNATPVNVECGEDLIIDLGASTTISTTTLVFYEYYNPDDSSCMGGICLDRVYIEVSNEDPVFGLWTEVFQWGDNNDFNNGDIRSYHFIPPPERDNEGIPPDELYEGAPGIFNGIQILMNQVFRYINIGTRSGCNDPAQVDAIDVWTPTPPP
jgi:hypothetical protein